MSLEPLSMNEPSESNAVVPIAAYLLADHLDAALAAGEDLMAISGPPGSGENLSFGHEIAIQRDGLRQFVENVRGLELALISRCIRARERGAELAAADARFKAIASLLVAGTAPLVDAVAECADATEQDFESGDDVLAYLRQRALVAEDAEDLDGKTVIGIGEGFLVARRIALGPLLDLVATFLDALELHFDLYDVEVADDMHGPLQAEAA